MGDRYAMRVGLAVWSPALGPAPPLNTHACDADASNARWQGPSTLLQDRREVAPSWWAYYTFQDLYIDQVSAGM